MNWTLIHKYLADECTPEERETVENWLRLDKRNQEFMEFQKRIWDVKPDDEIRVNAKAAWSSFLDRISEEEASASESGNISYLNNTGPRSGYSKLHLRERRRYGRTIAVSVAVAAVMLIAFLFTRYVPVMNEASQAQSQLTMQEIVTSKGQRTTFRLSDGTRVSLNADSKIEIPGEFMDSTRKIFLEGEAFFEVTHNPGKPFLVYTGEAFTRVLGTKFGVRAYSGEDHIQVVVTEGKVALGSENQSEPTSKEITRNQIGIFSKDGETKVTNIVNIQQYVGWKEGKLVFVDTPFREVRPHLERWFDIVCTVADPSLDDQRITVTFEGEPMTEVLNVIALSMDMSYEREGRKITFRDK